MKDIQTSESTDGTQISANPPSSGAIWAAYAKVNYVTIPREQNDRVWDLVGGNVGARFGPVQENSCATRLSYALNYGGAPIPNSAQASFGAWKNFTTEQYRGTRGDGKNYIVSAASLQSYLTQAWGKPGRKLSTNDEVDGLVGGLQAGQCAVFATGGQAGHGHAGMLKAGYEDPYVRAELPVDAWILPLVAQILPVG